MVLGFYPQFVAPIQAGTKIHTLRVDPANRWHGKYPIKIHMAIGVRTKNYMQFHSAECTGIQTVKIDWSTPYEGLGTWLPVLTIDGKKQPPNVLQRLAVNDGFETIAAFLEWFNKGFDGKIIHWTSYRY